MEIFEYIAVLTSIIIGLGITQLLRGVARLIQHPGRYPVYWVHLLWVASMFFNMIFWWWWEFRLNEIENWTFQLYFFVVFYAFVFYLTCALLFPRDIDEYGDFKTYFFSRHTWFFGLLGFSIVIDVGDSWLKGSEHFSNLGLEYIIATPVKFGLITMAMFLKNERFHATLAIVFLAYQVMWAFRMFETVV